MILETNFQSPTLKKVNNANLPHAGFPLGQGNQGSQGSQRKPENLLEDQGKSGKLEIFWKKSGKSQGTKFLSMQFSTSIKKLFALRNVCSLIVYDNQFYI